MPIDNMWALVRDDRPWGGPDPPGVVFRYAPGRGGKHGDELLKGFSGTVQIDGYSGHNILARPERDGGALTRALCLAHVRRRPEGGVRLERLADRVGGPAADRSALRDREENPG